MESPEQTVCVTNELERADN